MPPEAGAAIRAARPCRPRRWQARAWTVRSREPSRAVPPVLPARERRPGGTEPTRAEPPGDHGDHRHAKGPPHPVQRARLRCRPNTRRRPRRCVPPTGRAPRLAHAARPAGSPTQPGERARHAADGVVVAVAITRDQSRSSSGAGLSLCLAKGTVAGAFPPRLRPGVAIANARFPRLGGHSWPAPG